MQNNGRWRKKSSSARTAVGLDSVKQTMLDFPEIGEANRRSEFSEALHCPANHEHPVQCVALGEWIDRDAHRDAPIAVRLDTEVVCETWQAVIDRLEHLAPSPEGWRRNDDLRNRLSVSTEAELNLSHGTSPCG